MRGGDDEDHRGREGGNEPRLITFADQWDGTLHRVPAVLPGALIACLP